MRLRQVVVVPGDAVGRDLLPHHAALISASAIADEVRDDRGYYTATTSEQLANLGFAATQTRVPALVLPIYGPSGDLAGHQVRPDHPRILDGKPVKYETPARGRLHLDVPPRVRHLIDDPRQPLIVTEGIRKADAAASKGLCCIGLVGVWGWRGRDGQGRAAPLAEWKDVAVYRRIVYIAFDSDGRRNPAVFAAAQHLRRFLTTVGALVRVVWLPDGPDHTKVGLDDFFAAGNSAEDFLALPHATVEGGPPTALNLTSNSKGGDREVRSLEEWNADDVLGMDLSRVPPSLPVLGRDGIVMRGCAHVLSGYPKFGKTTLLVQAMTEWLGDGLHVLYFTEESKQVWSRRMRATSANWPNLHLIPAMGPDCQSMLSRAEQGTEDVVVIDTIRSVLALRDENDNSEVARAVLPWIGHLCREREKTLVLVHHNRKGGGDHGEAIAGGHALFAAVDVAIEVARDSSAENRRVVRTHSRVSDGIEFIYEKDRTSGALIGLGDPGSVRLEEVSKRVLEVLSHASDWAATAQLHDGLDEPRPSEEQLRRALQQLAERGVVERSPTIAERSVRGKRVTWRINAACTPSNLTSNGQPPTVGGEVPPGAGRDVRVRMAV
jgi:hypothetical protein